MRLARDIGTLVLFDREMGSEKCFSTLGQWEHSDRRWRGSRAGVDQTHGLLSVSVNKVLLEHNHSS